MRASFEKHIEKVYATFVVY